MFITDIRKLGLSEALVSVFEEGTGKYLRMLVKPTTINLFKESFKNQWPDSEPPSINSVFSVDVSAMSQELPGIFQEVIHPVTKAKQTLHSAIMDLNDAQGWTREQIADWIETLDNPPKFGVKNESPF